MLPLQKLLNILFKYYFEVLKLIIIFDNHKMQKHLIVFQIMIIKLFDKELSHNNKIL